VRRPAWFSSDYDVSTTSNTYTMGGAFGSHNSGGNRFFGLSLVWDGISSGAILCVYTFDGSEF